MEVKCHCSKTAVLLKGWYLPQDICVVPRAYRAAEGGELRRLDKPLLVQNIWNFGVYGKAAANFELAVNLIKV